MSVIIRCDRCGETTNPEQRDDRGEWLILPLPARTDTNFCPQCAWQFCQIVNVFIQKLPLRVVADGAK